MGSPRAAAFLAAFLLVGVGSAGGATPPFHPTGGLAFGAAAPIDPTSTSEQPNLVLGDDGTLWLSSSTQGHSDFVRRSSDDGKSFRAASPTGIAPAGDTSIAVGDGGAIYAVAQVSGSVV